MSRITAYSALTQMQADNVLPLVDVHDTSMAATGTTKKITLRDLRAASGGLYYPTGMRRWRAALGLADQQVVPLVAAGDSITYGQGSDNTLTTTGTQAALKSWPSRLGAMFGSSYRTLLQNPGPGFTFSNDDRVTVGGSPVRNLWASTAFGQGYRLVGASQTLTITIPSGVTRIGVIQGNQTQAFNSAGSNQADVTGQYNINGGANTAMTTLTNTGVPIVTTVAVTAGNTFQVLGPATAQTYISGFIMSSAATSGIQVHRVGVNGTVSGSLLGGQSSGTLVQTSGNQVTAARSVYQFCSTPGLLIVGFSVNDQQFSLGGGAGSQNGVTLAKYTAWNTQFAAQAVADGWCVLFLAGPRDVGFTGDATLAAYMGALKGIAAANDHMSFIDLGEWWGSFASSQADALQITSPPSVHPNTAGYGDIAWLLYSALLGQPTNGMTELVPG